MFKVSSVAFYTWFMKMFPMANGDFGTDGKLRFPQYPSHTYSKELELKKKKTEQIHSTRMYKFGKYFSPKR